MGNQTYTVPKKEGCFYVDYAIQDGKCFIIQEHDCRVSTNFVCNTSKAMCEDLQETETDILITI